jgi:putative ABC transport system permease protein
MIEYYLKMVSQFIEDMRKQKLRCLLTMSGITWGTMSVILLLAFGESFREAAMKSMSGMGSNIVIMGGGRTTISHSGMPPGRSIQLREDAATYIDNNIPEIGELSPEIERYVQMSAGTTKQSNRCVGVYPVYGIMRNLIPQQGGRFIDRLDMENRRRVIFLGTQIQEKFFGKEADPVGKTITVNGIPFTVIGVMQKKIQNSSYMNRDEDIAFLPFTTCREIFGITYIARIICRARSVVETPALKERTYTLLGRKLGFSPDDKEALWMWDTSEMTRFMHYFFLGFEAFLLMGGMFTLIVGGIGVANIMYVTVRERRREIGIKSALGATPRLILSQFLLESFLIMFLGGGIGVTMAWIVVTLFGMPAFSGAHTFLGTPTIDLPIAIITVTLLALIGFAAGWSPAKAASDMDPVRALEF